MKSPIVTKYLDNLPTYNLTQMYHDLLLETDMVKYLVLKIMKEKHNALFSSFVDVVTNIDSQKRIFHDVLRFYEEQKLEYCHKFENGYPNIKLYI